MSCQYTDAMKRNEVIQFRVTPEEKAELQELSGGDMSRYIRMKIWGADEMAKRAQAGEDLPGVPQVTVEALKDTKPVFDDEWKEKQFKRLVAQLQGKGRNLAEAEAEARKRLGLE
jgi:hypothetical protein